MNNNDDAANRSELERQDHKPLCEERFLIDVLSAFLNDRTPPTAPEGLREKRFLKIVKFQRVGAIVADELKKKPDLFSKELLKETACLRAADLVADVAFQRTREMVDAVFEENKIQYVPLKGAILKNFYPQSYQRCAADYDVLLKEREIGRAQKALVKKIGFTVDCPTPEHLCLGNNFGLVPLELHRKLTGRLDDPIFDDPWSRVLPPEDEAEKNSCKRRFTNEFFYFHVLSHLARHWLMNGATVRQFLDVWILNERFGAELDRAALDDFFERAGLLEFARNVERVVDVWFANRESDEITDAMLRRLFNPPKRRSTTNDPFLTPVSKTKTLIDRACSIVKLNVVYYDLDKRPWGTRTFWTICYWFKTILRRLQKGRIKKIRQVLRADDAKNANDDQREAERRFGIVEPSFRK